MKVKHKKQLKKPVAVVCVTDQRTCERMIHAGASFAQENGYDLRIVSVQPAAQMDAAQCGALEYLFSISIEVGAEMTVLYSKECQTALLRCLERIRPVSIMVGMPDGRSGVVASLREKFTNTSIRMINGEGEMHTLPPLSSPKSKPAVARATCAAY